MSAHSLWDDIENIVQIVHGDQPCSVVTKLTLWGPFKFGNC